MIKETLQRGTKGFAWFVAVSYLMGLFVSRNIGDGSLHMVFPSLLQLGGNEYNGAIIQFFFAGIVGFIMGAITTIWDAKRFTLKIKALINYAVMIPTVLLTAFLMNWMPHTAQGFLIWLLISNITYAICFTITYFICKATKKAN